MSVNSNIYIVIPAWNEAQNIATVLANLAQYDYQVVVVNDGSIDETAQEVKKFANVYLLSHLINRGMGAALQTGNEFAVQHGAEVIVHFDADGQMQAKDIESMIAPIVSGEVDITMGSRHMGMKSNLPWLKRYIIQPPAKVINFLFTGMNLTDVHNGFRALNRKTAEKIEIKQDGMAHATEILQCVSKYDLRYQEIPVKIIYHDFGQGLVGGFKILRDLIIRR
ncbi:MAG: glycosyltransferase family 2 protein [Candidatus Komeilibacteria bacterium]